MPGWQSVSGEVIMNENNRNERIRRDAGGKEGINKVVVVLGFVLFFFLKYSGTWRQNSKRIKVESQPRRHRQTDRQLREEDASRECKWEGSASKKWLLLLQLSLACVVGNKFCHYGGSYHHANCGGCRVLACSVRHVTRERARGRNRWWGWWSSHTNTTHAKYLESTLVLFHCPVITATVFYRHLLLWGPDRHEQEKTDKWMTNVRLIRTKTLQWTFQGASQDAT